jgi:hypothetical protein
VSTVDCQESNFLDSDTLRKFNERFASPFSVDHPTDALIPPVLLFSITSTSAITSKTLNSCPRIQTVCQTLVIKWVSLAKMTTDFEINSLRRGL